jgi:hypothetical protein
MQYYNYIPDCMLMDLHWQKFGKLIFLCKKKVHGKVYIPLLYRFYTLMHFVFVFVRVI